MDSGKKRFDPRSIDEKAILDIVARKGTTEGCLLCKECDGCLSPEAGCHLCPPQRVRACLVRELPLCL